MIILFVTVLLLLSNQIEINLFYTVITSKKGYIMKINLHKIKSYYNKQIAQAIANNYEAVLIPLEYEMDIYCLNNSSDEDYIIQIAEDYGWNRFIILDFLSHSEKMIDLYELEAA